MTLGGSISTVVAIFILYFSFINLPGDASHGPLAEAIGPWMLLVAVSILTLFLGIILWIVGYIAELVN